MNKLLYTLMASAALCSCASEYQIDGRTSVSSLDGKKLYIKVVRGDDLVNLDSCEVVHGNFSMNGKFDTVRMAELFMGDVNVLPLVLEPTPLTISIDDTIMKVTGSDLNDKLYEFLNKKVKIDAQAAEIPRRESRMYMDGKDDYEIHQMKEMELSRLNHEYDQLIMEYVTNNFDNVLSVGIFMMLTSGTPPMMNPQIEDIMSKATPAFKENTYVKGYLKAADENMRRMGR